MSLEKLANDSLALGQLPEGAYVVDDSKRVFVLYSDNPEKDVQGRAKKIKAAWEKLHGENTCEVVVVKLNERLESLV